MEENKILLRSVLDLNQAPKDEPIKIYDRDDIPVAIISNYNEWQYTRLQIRKYKIEGCYFYFNGEKYTINSNGMLPDYPNGLFFSGTKMTAELALRNSAPKYIPKSKLINVDKRPENRYVEIYDNEDNLIIHTNSDLDFNWVKARIKEKNLKGCYLIFEGKRIEINEKGCEVENPKGLFDNNLQALCDLV